MSDPVQLDMGDLDVSGHGPVRPGMSDPPVADRSIPSAQPDPITPGAGGYTISVGRSVEASAVSTRPSFFRRSFWWILATALSGVLAAVIWPSSDLLGHHDDPVAAVAVGKLEGRPVAVSTGNGYYDSTLRMWDLTTGDPIGEPIAAHPEGVTSLVLGEVDGQPVAVTGGYDNAVRIWDLTTRRLVGDPIRIGNTERVDAVAVGEVSGRAVVIAAGDWGDATHKLPVRVWDLATHEPFGEPLVGHTGLVWSVALGEMNGRVIVVTGSNDGTTRVWDLTTRKQIGDPMISSTGVGDVALGWVDGRQVVISSDEKDIRVWDLAAHQLIGAPIPTGHTYGVRALTVGEVNGRPVVLTGGGYDEDGGGAVQVWDLRTHKPLGGRMRYANWVGDIAIGHVAGKVVAVTGDGDGDVRMRDLSASTR
ncbi:WD40 repeat domain-containing protein [Planomonospora sp. ID82291]|uniref:WD40 repeat domain-containing protein n=1 Tax=Planomonospora sp. ID82291 TaxID=2738136 RepID=UPI0018C4192A|nr:WD40 repeat domain-containing protein [Planomonospora sp. ID82291]MBG0814914.1 WD40 repeat domain-containing protein [Planomonospora sp. ID82291]